MGKSFTDPDTFDLGDNRLVRVPPLRQTTPFIMSWKVKVVKVV